MFFSQKYLFIMWKKSQFYKNLSKMYEIMALVQKYQILIYVSFTVFLNTIGKGKCCHSETSLHLEVLNWLSFWYLFWAHCEFLAYSIPLSRKILGLRHNDTIPYSCETSTNPEFTLSLFYPHHRTVSSFLLILSLQIFFSSIQNKSNTLIRCKWNVVVSII